MKANLLHCLMAFVTIGATGCKEFWDTDVENENTKTKIHLECSGVGKCFRANITLQVVDLADSTEKVVTYLTNGDFDLATGWGSPETVPFIQGFPENVIFPIKKGELRIKVKNMNGDEWSAVIYPISGDKTPRNLKVTLLDKSIEVEVMK